MSEDASLLRRYALEHSEAAFAELVRRHVDLVYSAALRLLNGDTHRAQDLTQQVFSELARQAKSLARHPALDGWLYTTTRRMAWRVIRTEQRRTHRERMAHDMHELLGPSADEAAWEQLGPALDDAMHELNEADRLALLLRYFKNKSLREVGLALGLTENAARMRVDRALDKLRSRLARQGLTSTAGALALAVSARAVGSAPPGFAAAVAKAASTAAGAAGGSSLSILKFMAATKLKAGLAALALASAALILVVEHHARLNAEQDNDSLRRQLARLQADNDALSARLDRANRERASRSASLNGAPAGTAGAGGSAPVGSLRARLVANPVKISTDQLAGFLARRHRDASSLLASYRVTHDPALLQEAMQKFPNDAQVDFEALLRTNAAPGESRQWLAAFESSDPGNSLGNYLSAKAYFDAGQPGEAVKEMAAAAGKTGFQDYTTERIMDDREAYVEAGCSPPVAEVSSCTSLLLPQLQQVRDLGLDLVDLSKTYQQAGDSDSAQAALQMAASLGQRYSTSTPGETEISQLVGMFVEHAALNAMDASQPFGGNGQSVQDELNQLNQQKSALNALSAQVEPLMDTMSDDDYLTYKDRWMAFGEEAAARWVIGKYSQP